MSPSKRLCTCVVLIIATAGARLWADEPARVSAPDILIVRDGWDAPQEDVRRVLESTAAELWRYFPDRKLPPLIVYPRGGPIVYDRRGPDGEYFVHLNTGKTYWAQYAFQFSHEFCHVLCNFDRDDHGNDWFEESLCELASMFALRRMAQTWKTAPPYDHWKDFAPHLAEYADDLIGAARLPEGQTLAAWYAAHAEELHGTSAKRELNRVVAAALLPLFEKSPEHWAAVSYLNTAQPAAPQTLAQFLTDWHHNAPEKHRPFIRRIAGEFGITLDGAGSYRR